MWHYSDEDITKYRRKWGFSAYFNNILVYRLKSTVKGASEVIVIGGAEKQDLIISGASNYNALQCSSSVINLKVKGASSAYIRVIQTLSGTISGASKVQYRGTASVTVTKKGASSCKKIT